MWRDLSSNGHRDLSCLRNLGCNFGKQIEGSVMRTLGIIALGLVLLCGHAMTSATSASDFNPVRKLSTWYTDRTPVDVEVSSSPEAVESANRQASRKNLRFRLERAFVHQLLTGLDETIVRFGFDMDTGLPDQLIIAVSDRGRFQEIIPGIPNVPFEERLVRTVLVTVKSNFSAVSLQRFGEKLKKCAAAATSSDLINYEMADRNSCRKPSYPQGSRHLAKYGDTFLLVECHEPGFRGIGCELLFPFEGFGVQVHFHRDHLSRWRTIVDQAASFLKSKQYRTGEGG
jgi:hypothetical protein